MADRRYLPMFDEFDESCSGRADLGEMPGDAAQSAKP